MKDQKEDYLVANLKYILESSGLQQDSADLDAGIRNKKDEIEDICSRNMNTMIGHYQKYYALKKRQRDLQAKVDQFNLKIQNFKRLENYSTQEIDTMAKNINHIDEVLTRARQYKSFVELAKRAAKSIEDEKYTNSIRFINKMKGHQILVIKSETPLHHLFPIFRAKISTHLSDLFVSFGVNCQKKYSEYGTGCFNRVYSKEKERRSIYQALFSKSRNLGSSYINMNTSSLQFEESHPTRSSVFQDFAPIPKAARTKSTKLEGTRTLTVRIKLDYYQLKQAQFIYTELKEEAQFRKDLKENGRAELNRLEAHSEEVKSSIKEFLIEIVGFLMVRRQLIATFKLDEELEVLVAQIIHILKTKGRNLRKHSHGSQAIVDMKDAVQVFFQILDALNVKIQDALRHSLFRELFKTYCNVRRQEYGKIIQEMLQKDSHIKYVTTNEEEFKSIQKILGLPDIDKEFTSYEFTFTQIVPYISNMFNMFFQEAFSFLQEGHDQQGQLHVQFQKLYLTVLDSFSLYLRNIDNPLLISQGQANLEYLSRVFKYYSTRLELDHEVFRIKEYTCHELQEKIKVQLALKTREIIETKIDQQMHSYTEINWAPAQPMKTHHDFLEWLMEYIHALVIQMKEYGFGFDKEIIYAIMSFINHKYWEILTSEISQFNLLGIYNLNLDLMCIYKICTTHFKAYDNLMDKLKSVRQLVDLLLTGNLGDLLDHNKKRILYSDVAVEKVLLVLEHYNPGRVNSKVVRELKKKDVEAFMKKARQS